MSVWCRMGLHKWERVGGDLVRNKDGRVRLHWECCARRCGAARIRGKKLVP